MQRFYLGRRLEGGPAPDYFFSLRAPYPQRKILLVTLVVFLPWLFSCASTSPEDQILAWVDRAVQRAEERDLPAMMDLVSDNYSDDEGRDKKVIRGLLLYYFRSNRSVYVWKKVKSLQVADSETAQLTLAVILAGKPFAEDMNLTKFQADMLRFDFVLEKDGRDWRVIEATWKPVKFTEFL